MIVIIGAGVIGASVAWHLAKRGEKVRVIDRAPTLGGGSTPKATGGFRAQFASEIDVRLSLLSRAKLREFDSGYAPHGYLFLARSAAELDELRAAQALQHACGLDEARMVSAAEARKLNPAIGDDSVIGGAFCPTDGFIRAMKILNHYVDGSRAMGVEFAFDCDYERFDGKADVLVDCRGAWAGAPIVPVRRNAVATVQTTIVPESMPMTVWASDWYHIRVRDGRVLLLWSDDPPNDETWLPTVQRWTRERVPMLSELPIEESWSGFYEMTPDEHPLVGRVSENRYIAAGFCGHGVMHSPAIGQLMAELILDGTTTIDISALDPGRFGVR
jgi:sarcosine oxidase subunit beta